MYIRGLVLPSLCLSFVLHATSYIFIQYNYVSLCLLSPVFPPLSSLAKPPLSSPSLAKPAQPSPCPCPTVSSLDSDFVPWLTVTGM
jgi:hypothetical protein